MNFENLVISAKSKYYLNNTAKPSILIGTATCGRSAGALHVLEALNKIIENQKIDCEVAEVGCIGICYAEPVVLITKANQPAIVYGNITDKIIPELINSYLGCDDPLTKYAIGSVGKTTIDGIPELFSTPIFKRQVRRISKRCGFIDPTNISHYLATGGYLGLSKALTMRPEEIIDEVKMAGLRGRGGGGFLAWRKWTFCREANQDQKYLICNADEGDPGASMNRMLLESDPHAILEGMAIAAYAIGASKGYIYCRAEYPLAIERLNLAIKQATELGFLGDNIFGSNFSLHLKIKEGAGAFVCGEETALIASIEGGRGMPRFRPPFPAVSGLWGKPTIINNVETLAATSHIFQNSAAWFTEYGTEKSSGTKIFSLVGKVKYPCMPEIPLGMTLREVVYDIGGGVSGDKKLKAIQTGGPSGGSIPVDLIDTPIDYDSLNQAGTIMGSGGLVVMDEDDCMVDIARYFLDFTQKESCGECVPCRLGTKQMLELLSKITNGEGAYNDLELLTILAGTIQKTALCGLGRSAPNPVLTTLRYFRNEYIDHIVHKSCTAKSCRKLMHYFILPEKCIGCDACAKNCPANAIIGAKKELHIINQENCIKCGMCFQVCPNKVRAVAKMAGAVFTVNSE